MAISSEHYQQIKNDATSNVYILSKTGMFP